MSNERGGLKYGCVIFDDPRQREQGWKAIEEDKATRVSSEGTSALRSDVVWLTNMDYDLVSVTGLRDNFRFLHSKYMREDMAAICSRYQLTDNRICAEIGAKLFSRTMRLSSHLLEAEDFTYKTSLSHAFRDIIGFGRDPVVTTEICKVIDDACVYNTNCEREWSNKRENDVIGVFRIPPRQHCLDILNSTLPYGEFVEVPKNVLPERGANRKVIQEFLQSCEKTPGLFKITCERFNPNFNSLINYGDSPSPYGAYRRSWVTYPEALMLSSLSDMIIHQALLPLSTYKLKEAANIASSLVKQADMSLSMGIFFENLWTGMSVAGKKICATDPNKIYINVFTPFLRAMDRLLLLDRAIQFKKAGFEVIGYSTGRLRVNLIDKHPIEAFKIALETGTIPPFLGLKEDDLSQFTSIFNEKKDDPLFVLQFWHATNNLEQMMMWDQKVVNYYTQKRIDNAGE